MTRFQRWTLKTSSGFVEDSDQAANPGAPILMPDEDSAAGLLEYNPEAEVVPVVVSVEEGTL